MELKTLPLINPRPDCDGFIGHLLGSKPLSRTPLVEYIVDDVVMRPILTGLLGREWVPAGPDLEARKAYLDNLIEFWYRMGYDFVRLEIGSGLTKNTLFAPDTTPGSGKTIGWADEHRGTISSWEDFERYPWPNTKDLDLFPLEYINSHLPEGMGFISCHCGGIFEQVSGLLSLEGLCFALYDNQELVKAVTDRVGELIAGFYERLFELDRLVAIFQGDDMGYRTGTMIAPLDLRTYFLPWHKRFAEKTHAKGLPYFLHSCGRIDEVMEDLIEDVRIDGKHSFENTIYPVQEFQARYGNRIAVLGGMDVHLLSAGTPEDIRRHARLLIETCGKRGRYALGSGNSIPSYVPWENYLAMVDETISHG